jgi:hypothetical protein
MAKANILVENGGHRHAILLKAHFVLVKNSGGVWNWPAVFLW